MNDLAQYIEDLTVVMIKRQALRRGLSVDKYLAALREETIQYAMNALKLSRDEVIAQKLDNRPRSGIVLEVQRRKLSEKLGWEVTIRELLDRDRERMRASSYPWPDCLRFDEVKEYAKTGAMEPKNVEHLTTCAVCSNLATVERSIYLENQLPPGLECLSGEELVRVGKGERLPESRLTHVDSCRRCTNAFGKNQELWLDEVAPLLKLPWDRSPVFMGKEETSRKRTR
jgi:hypothetical protein